MLLYPAFILFVSLLYPTATASKRIAVVYSTGSKSHFLSVKPAIETLAECGHQITLFTPFQGISKGIINAKEVLLSETQQSFEKMNIDWFAIQKGGPLAMFAMATEMGEYYWKGAIETLKNPEFRRIIAERDVDLFITDCHGNEFMYPVIDLVKIPFVTHCSTSPIPTLLAALGGPPEYATAPSPFTDYDDSMGFLQRLYNSVMSTLFQVSRELFWYRMMDKLVAETFPDAKTIRETETEVSIAIINSHVTTTFPRSLPPTVIPIPALQTRPAKELPQDFKKIADDSKEGFIVFTLGSFIPVSSMPKEMVQSFMRVFSKLSQNVVWKWEAEIPEDVPKNVVMADWIPQQDLLGHPNAKLLIFHGGLAGTQEAIYHGVPMLSLPFANDQKANVVKAKRDGFAVQLDWNSLNDDVLFSAISHLVYDPKVRESAAKASQLMRDELLPGKDLAVYWMEYVMRNNGTKHLQLASKNMPFYKLYLLDVISFLALLFSVGSYSFYRLTRFLVQRYVFARRIKTTKTN